MSEVLLVGNMDTFEYYKNVNHNSVLILESGHFLQIMTIFCLEFNQGVHSSVLIGNLKIQFNIYLYQIVPLFRILNTFI